MSAAKHFQAFQDLLNADARLLAITINSLVAHDGWAQKELERLPTKKRALVVQYLEALKTLRAENLGGRP